MTVVSESSRRTPVFAKPLEIVRPTFPPLEAFADKFRAALATGQVTNNGPWVLEFERRLESYLRVPTIVFSSGQAALMTMLQAAGVHGGEVVVPSLTFSATPHAALWSGAQPVFADAKDDMSFTVDPADVERAITGRTTAILSVDPYGIPCDYEALVRIGQRHKIPVLLDSAASFGARYDGVPVGGFGNAQIFSFHATKAFATMEGGCLSSHDPDLLRRAREIRNFGQRGGADCDIAGLNGKMMEVCALIGIEQLARFEAAASVRRSSAQRIVAGLKELPGLSVPRVELRVDPIWLYLPVVVEPAFGCDRDETAERLARENLNVRKYYSPACHRLTVYQGGNARPLLVAERLTESVIALPIYNDMSEAECDGIVEAFRRARG